MCENVLMSPIAVYSNLKKLPIRKKELFCRGAEESSREAGVSSLVACLACPSQCNDDVFTREIPQSDMNDFCLHCPIQIYIHLQIAQTFDFLC